MMGISGHFVGERKPLGVMKTREYGAAVRRRIRGSSTPRASASTPFAGPVAILVDAMSGSASECFAGGMQSIGRARVFGQTVDGAGAAGALRSPAERRRPDPRLRRFRDRRRHAPRRARRHSGRNPAARSRASCSPGATGRSRRRSPGSTGPKAGGRRTSVNPRHLPGYGCACDAASATIEDLRIVGATSVRRDPAPTGLFSSHTRIISGEFEWSSAGCDSATYWMTTVRVSGG